MSFSETPKTKYSGTDVARDIERTIIERSLARGVKLPTSREFAVRYNVSHKTVERALTRLRSKGLISRVPGNGTFVLSNRSQLRKMRVGLFTWNWSASLDVAAHAAFYSSRDLLIHRLQEKGFQVEALEENFTDKQNLKMFRTSLEKFDIVIASAGILDTGEEYLKQIKTHIILAFDDIVRMGPWHQVVYDYTPGFAKALRHLKTEKGVGKFFVVGIEEATSEHRMNAFLQEALQVGVRREDCLFRKEKCNLVSLFPVGQNLASYYIEHALFDHAILCTSDFIVYGMCSKFKEHGLLPGRDFKIVSYDNFESRLPSGEYNLGISGITHPIESHVNALASLVESLDRIPTNGEFYKTYFVPATEFIVRTST